MESSQEPEPRFSTRAIHIGGRPDDTTGAVIPPLSLSTTFLQDGVGRTRSGNFEYSRSSNPNRKALEAVLASLEDGEQAFAFSSGSAATATVVQAVASSQGASHVVSISDVYGGTYRFLTQVAAPVQGLETTFVDLDQVSDEEIYSAIQDNTKLIWIESPSNPTLRVVSVHTIVKIARSHPSRPFVVVDNTFLSPYWSNPLRSGADLVLHSVSKYINGHSDVIMGAVIARRGLGDLATRIGFLQNASGAIPSPFDCYLALRGAKTLALRAFQHGISALAIARHLEGHPLVDSVLYPGLPSHPSHAIAQQAISPHAWRDLKSKYFLRQELSAEQGIPFSGMISFRIAGGAKEAERFLMASKLFSLAESLGGVESLGEVPSAMTHASIPEEERLKLGITPNLIRLSVGVEDTEDLIADIEQALHRAVRS